MQTIENIKNELNKMIDAAEREKKYEEMISHNWCDWSRADAEYEVCSKILGMLNELSEEHTVSNNYHGWEVTKGEE